MPANAVVKNFAQARVSSKYKIKRPRTDQRDQDEPVVNHQRRSFHASAYKTKCHAGIGYDQAGDVSSQLLRDLTLILSLLPCLLRTILG